MDPFTSNRSNGKDQPQSVDPFAAWDDEPSPPSLTTQMILQIILILGELLIITGVKLRNLNAQRGAYSITESPCESPC